MKAAGLRKAAEAAETVLAMSTADSTFIVSMRSFELLSSFSDSFEAAVAEVRAHIR